MASLEGEDKLKYTLTRYEFLCKETVINDERKTKGQLVDTFCEPDYRLHYKMKRMTGKSYDVLKSSRFCYDQALLLYRSFVVCYGEHAKNIYTGECT